MRTTLTLDSDVVRLIEDAVHRQRRPMKQVINDAIRAALGPAVSSDREPYRLVPRTSALSPGLDPVGLNRLADRVDDDASIAAATR